MSVAWPIGVQLLVFFCSSVPVVLFDTSGISRCRSQHVSVESSSLLHHSICDLFVSRDDPLMSKKSKKTSNDQELIQSDPISCPHNQKGNN